MLAKVFGLLAKEEGTVKFSDIILTIEKNIEMEYLPGAIKYINTHYNDAWSKAIDRFDTALFGDLDQPELSEGCKLDVQLYLDSILKFINIYKNRKNKSAVDRLLQ